MREEGTTFEWRDFGGTGDHGAHFQQREQGLDQGPDGEGGLPGAGWMLWCAQITHSHTPELFTCKSSGGSLAGARDVGTQDPFFPECRHIKLGFQNSSGRQEMDSAARSVRGNTGTQEWKRPEDVKCVKFGGCRPQLIWPIGPARLSCSTSPGIDPVTVLPLRSFKTS